MAAGIAGAAGLEKPRCSRLLRSGFLGSGFLEIAIDARFPTGHVEARAEFGLAAELTGNGRERALLLARAGALDSSGRNPSSQSKSS
jgi:hypothetical protein